MRRIRRGGLLAATVSGLAIASALAAAPVALAVGPDSWTGAGASPDWSLGSNWSGGQGLVANQSYPQGLSFDDLAACDADPSTGPCYSSTDDVPVTLGQISLDDNLPYKISAANSAQVNLLGSSPGGTASSSTGISAAPGSGSPSGTTPEISVPLVIPAGSDQTWDIAGDSSGHQQSLAVDSLSTSSPLDVNLTGGASLEAKSITGGQPIAVSGGAAENPSNLAGRLSFDGASGSDLDSGGSITLSDGASLYVTTSGTVSSGSVAIAADGHGANFVIGSNRAPDTVLDAGTVSLQPEMNNLALSIDSACGATGCTPGTDNSELVSSSAFNPNGAQLTLTQGTDAQGLCDELVLGQTYTLISATSVTGTFAGVSDGTSVSLGDDCGPGAQATSTYVTIHYTSTAISATVTAVGNASGIPQTTGAAPVITNKSRKTSNIFAGDKLSVSRGTWNLSGSSNPQTALHYSYTWLRCPATGACSQIGGQSQSTYTTSASDIGDAIYAEVTATNALGTKQAASAKVGPVLAVVAPSYTRAPRISGTTTLGSTLRLTSRGAWTGRPAPGYKYQWLLCPANSTASCAPSGTLGSAKTLTLTAADLGKYPAIEVRASNRGGTTLAISNLRGPVLPTHAAVLQALVQLRHPSGQTAIRTLIRHGSFTTGFTAPSGGALRITWRTTITAGTGGHRRNRSLTLARGSARYGTLGSERVTVRLTRIGRTLLSGTLLKRNPRSVRIAATEAFEPVGGSWTTYRARFTPVTVRATVPSSPSTAQVRAALSGIGHPSGSGAIKALIKGLSFRARFTAPSAGSLSVTWTTSVTTGRGKHRKYRPVTVASGHRHAGGAGRLAFRLHLTAAGRVLLRQKPHSLQITATAKFEPSGGTWTALVSYFTV